MVDFNKSTATWEEECYWWGHDPGSAEEWEHVHTPFACGFQEVTLDDIVVIEF